MHRILQRIKEYSTHNNRASISEDYNSISQHSLFRDSHGKNPFSAEIRMKNGILALQLNIDGRISRELVIILCFYFEQFSETKNCVWTRTPKKIKSFFLRGISHLIECGGEITLNIPEEDIPPLVDMLQKENTGNEAHNMLVAEFHMLEKKSWFEYEKYVEKLLQTKAEKKHIAAVTSMEQPCNWENPFSSDPRVADVSANSPTEGLMLSLNNLGKVDIEYISQITGSTCSEVIKSLKGAIYQNPVSWSECFYKGWETAEEYLSGNVMAKLKIAKTQNEKYNGYFAENVKALTMAIPKHVSTEDIYVTLGSPWVPPDIIDSFISDLFHNTEYRNNPDYATKFDEMTGMWNIPHKTRFSGRLLAEKTYGTSRMNALHIIERTLNRKSLSVTDTIDYPRNKSGKKRVINKTETLLIHEKQKQIISIFKDWIWRDPARKSRLHKIYEEKYGFRIPRCYNGDFLTFPEMNPSIKLYNYQKNAVARIILSPNALLAHDVGAGKTYTMIAAGMEMRRMGLSKKNLYVVPNTLVGQWKEMFLKLYPSSEVLCIDPKSFAGKNRQKVLDDICNNDYDGIIIAYSSFGLIPATASDHLLQLPENSFVFSQALGDLSSPEENNRIISFEDLGINTMFVDEAHNFKNVPINTKIKNVLGISPSGSPKCQDMMDKVRIVQKANGGGGIVFATGTPISNSLTDIYVMQKYLQNDELLQIGLGNFDNWVGMFAEQTSDFEIDVTTTNFRIATRFTKFNNMPELSALLSSVSDFYQVEKSGDIPEHQDYIDIVADKTPEFSAYLAEISQRAEAVRNNTVPPDEDNMLKITTDGRKAALDMRLVSSNARQSPGSKATLCAETVFEIYRKTTDSSLTQLIFCDTSIPKSTFNLYDELKSLLTSMGIPKSEIAYIHDAVSENKREELFRKVRDGEIRILIGSTFKLGLGVNVQDRLFALHHLDVPWRPSDMIQREGRILRSGNQNDRVEIYRYITKGSFDAYSWQILESKQRIISSILSGCVTQRMCEEFSDVILNYAEVKALSVGNPLLKKRVEISNALTRNLTLRQRRLETKQEFITEFSAIPCKLEHQRKLLEKCVEDEKFCRENEFTYNQKTRKELRTLIHNSLNQNQLSPEEIPICSYRGFDVVIPANMTMKNPYVYLKRCGKYRVDMGDSITGVLVRIDNFLNEIIKYRKSLNKALDRILLRENEIRKELESKDEYSGIIEELRKELKIIDEKLGVSQ